MIASLTGMVLSSSNGQAVIDVAGVGYLVHTTSSTVASLSEGQNTSFHTSLVVREDAFTLFGFVSKSELEVFELLRSVNGVGPKSALSILNQMSVEQIAQAVSQESDAAFKAVSGVGAKTAKLITLTLSGKMLAPATKGAPASQSEKTVNALVGLGWSERRARDAVHSIGNPGMTDKDLLKNALKHLSKAKKA